jgi:hypothetical protein
MTNLDQSVIDLHNIARTIEKEFNGASKLSIDCRRLADRLSAIIKPTSETKSTARGDQ